jgi:hypothetical protein
MINPHHIVDIKAIFSLNIDKMLDTKLRKSYKGLLFNN